jgi:hypothetical protein
MKYVCTESASEHCVTLLYCVEHFLIIIVLLVINVNKVAIYFL